VEPPRPSGDPSGIAGAEAGHERTERGEGGGPGDDGVRDAKGGDGQVLHGLDEASADATMPAGRLGAVLGRR
jgi:hypothetical protein